MSALSHSSIHFILNAMKSKWKSWKSLWYFPRWIFILKILHVHFKIKRREFVCIFVYSTEKGGSHCSRELLYNSSTVVFIFTNFKSVWSNEYSEQKKKKEMLENVPKQHNCRHFFGLIFRFGKMTKMCYWWWIVNLRWK